MTGAQDTILNQNELRRFYAEQFAYFNSLNSKCQEVFIKRCLMFISGKIIGGGQDFVVTGHMRALVAASAIQLTLGLETWSLDYFESIVIYPGDFDAQNGRQKYRGETNMNGYIKLSWRSFVYGYQSAKDNINLGIHEFSHALRFNGIRGSEQDYFIEHYFNGWLASALEAHHDIKNNRPTIFRKYGGVNINEFISVCIEHYFESPEEIKSAYPELYFSTAILLNQKTENGFTEIGVRERMLAEKISVVPGFSNHTFRSPLFQSNLFRMMMIVMCPLLFNVVITGIFSGLSLFFFTLCLLMFLCFDFRFTRATLQQKELRVEKGLLIFRRRRNLVMPSSQLISVRALSEETPNYEWQVIFYNEADGFFYEEHIYSWPAHNPVLVKELLQNKVAYFK